ncbi:hypothetical protein C0J52_05258 [Blattella germanica]|nr:hypothetical protein C0J52_05258 [Blattella germanica]
MWELPILSKLPTMSPQIHSGSIMPHSISIDSVNLEPCFKFTVIHEKLSDRNLLFNWQFITYLKTSIPPVSSNTDLRIAVRMSVFPSTTSSMCVYGHAVASPQLNAHQMVNRNKNKAYVDIPKLSATEKEIQRPIKKRFSHLPMTSSKQQPQSSAAAMASCSSSRTRLAPCASTSVRRMKRADTTRSGNIIDAPAAFRHSLRHAFKNAFCGPGWDSAIACKTNPLTISVSKPWNEQSNEFRVRTLVSFIRYLAAEEKNTAFGWEVQVQYPMIPRIVPLKPESRSPEVTTELLLALVQLAVIHRQTSRQSQVIRYLDTTQLNLRSKYGELCYHFQCYQRAKGVPRTHPRPMQKPWLSPVD